MAIGMTPEEFWDGDPALCESYRKAWGVRQSISNSEQWRMGAYVYSAVGAAVASCLDKEGHDYLERPLELDGEKKEEEKEQPVPAGVRYLQEYTARRKAARKKREEE